MTEPERIRPRIRDAIVQSLRAGVVPKVGQQYIQVGRIEELKALNEDIDRIADGGSSIRFVIGEYGSGKTFFLNLVRSIAQEKKLVTAHADLSPDRRIQATNGQGRSLYQELMKNLATRSKPEGGALESAVERFVTSALNESRETGTKPEVSIFNRLKNLTEMVGGFDFAEVIERYWRGHDSGDENLKSNAIRWLRGEFSARTDARNALGVRTIVDDGNVYDHLKLFARFVLLAGYSGFYVCLDELVNIYKLANTQARNSNYEQILRMLNDTLQGTATNIGFLLCGTPEFLLDTRKGLYSYSALQTRLAENQFSKDGLADYSGPVISLANLTPEDIYVLLMKVRSVYTRDKIPEELLPDEGIKAYMRHCSSKIGDAYFRTPRNTVTQFINLLAVLEQNPGVSWQALVGDVKLQTEQNPDLAPLENSDESDDDGETLASFKL